MTLFLSKQPILWVKNAIPSVLKALRSEFKSLFLIGFGY
jgi:hypothetical protein